MTQKSRRLIPVLLLFPGSALALGLGEVKLNSALNQPLNAEIALVAAAPDEVESLRASLASRETFARYGLDRPAFLSNLSLKAGKSASGEPVIVLRSNEAITEPFVTVLVEVSWNRGRLLREYTLLLDPPVFRDAAPAAAPVVAPRSGSAAGAVARPSTQPAEAPAAAPSDTTLGGEYRVRPNDSLSRIARATGATGRGEIDRTMVAIFRSNPSAFFGNNINRLRSGAILRMPGADEVAAVSASEASALVREQVAEWRSAAAAAGAAGADEPGRLRLVAPTDGSGGAGTAPADPALQGRVRALEGELAEARRLLELKNAELARLQGKAQPPAEAPVPAPVTPPAAEAPPAAEPLPAAPVAEEPAPAKEPEAAPAKKPRKPAKKPAVEEEGLLDSLGGTTGLVLGGALLLLAGGLGYGYLRRRREAAEDEFDQPRTGGMDGGNYGTGVFARPEMDPSASMVVVEDDGSGEFVPPPLVPLPSAAQAPSRNPEDTLSGETAIDLDKGDALSEADFHMAYGLYDQAADIVKLALQREPGRRDLKMKLLEVYFVWGKGDAFTEVARELSRSRDEAVPGEWDKVVIMGKQVAPQDALFAGAGTSAAGQSVDLNLEGGQGHVDLELLDGAMPGTPDAAGRGDDLVDFDLSSALGADDAAATGERPGLSGSGLDFVLDEPGRGAEGLVSTAEQALGQNAATMEQWRGDSPTVEQPVLRGSESPTMESPLLSAAPDSTMRERVDQAILAQRRDDRADQTAEMSLDDLNLDLGDADQSLDNSFIDLSPLETTGQPVSVDGLSDDAATMLSGLDQRSRTLMQSAGIASGADATARVPGLDSGSSDTAQLRALVPEMSALGGRVDDEYSLDMDLDALTRVGGGLDPAEVKTVETSADGIDDLRFSSDVFNNGAGGDKLDLDVGSETRVSRTLTERMSAEDLALPELEPVTLSEVGTKLDLARAYMDMGDPDGARSILQEVLAEGSASQKQEAGRLLESLPG